MDQAVHILAIALLVVALFYASVVLWMSLLLGSPRSRVKFIAIWLAVVCALVFVVYNPLVLPGLLRAFPLPPNPFTVSS